MAKVADYSIIADAWAIEGIKNKIEFEVPSNIDAGSRSILGFMLQLGSIEDMTLTLKMNGEKVWSWNFPDGQQLRFFQEVIPAGLLKPGTNNFTFHSTSESARFVQLSDIVVWWQANI